MKNLKPAEIREKIKRLKSQNALEKLCLQTWSRRSNDSHFVKKLKEQNDIISAAEAEKLKLKHQHHQAKKEIGKIKARIRYNNRVRVNLENSKEIEKLKETAKELAKLSKEMQDGKADNNS